MAKDYYKILGVDKGASDDEIKKAFRTLAHKHHPDKQGGDEARFKEINEAYQVLSDQKKRANYDRFGAAEGPAGAAGFDGSGFGWDFSQFSGFPGGFQGDVGDLGDIFEGIFGGAVRQQRKTGPARGSDMEISYTISLEDAFSGKDEDVSLKTLIECASCKGKGADEKEGFDSCTQCAGKGEVREEKRTILGSIVQVRECSKCSGAGKIPKKICKECKGQGRVSGSRSFSVSLPAGISDGQVIRIQGAGEAGEKGARSGDLYVRVRVKPHSTFERRGDDLVVKKNVTVYDLLLGRALEVPSLDKKPVTIEIPAHYDLKELYRVSGRGMPRMGQRGSGDLLVDLIVKAPKKVHGDQRKAIEDLE